MKHDIRNTSSENSTNVNEYLDLDDDMPTSNFSKQNFRNSSQEGLLNTTRVKCWLIRFYSLICHPNIIISFIS